MEYPSVTYLQQITSAKIQSSRINIHLEFETINYEKI